MAPDYGPIQARPNHGVALIGSGLWVTNFNMLLLTSEMRRAQRISTMLSERGGGLPGVQAMALPHQDGMPFPDSDLAPPPCHDYCFGFIAVGLTSADSNFQHQEYRVLPHVEATMRRSRSYAGWKADWRVKEVHLFYCELLMSLTLQYLAQGQGGQPCKNCL